MLKLFVLTIACLPPCYSEETSIAEPLEKVHHPQVQQDFAPDNLKGKILTLHFKHAFSYSMSGIEDGWYHFDNSKKLFQEKMEFEGTSIFLLNHANKPIEFFLRKIGPNTLILTWDSNPGLDPEKIEEIDEYSTSYLFHFTGKDRGTAMIITSPYSGESITLNIPFTIKDNVN